MGTSSLGADEKYVLNTIERLPEVNRAIAIEFNDYLIANDIKVRTRINYMQALKSFFSVIDVKDVKKVTRPEIERWVRVIKKKYNHNSANLYRVTVKKFFQWVYGMDEGYPNVVRWIKSKRDKSIPNEILSTEEILKLVNAAKNDRDRALVHVLYESAARVSEVLGLKIKDVALDDFGASIKVRGKTGERRIRLINSVPSITQWLNSHPFKDTPNSPLWFVEGYRKVSNGALGYKGLEFKLRGLAKRSGVLKPVNPHNFRHSRLTELAKQGYMESELRIIAGWEANSNMPAVYLHISGADIDRKMLSKAGILNEDEEIGPDEVLRPVRCPRCLKENPAGSKYCNCGLVLDSIEALKVDEVKEDLHKGMGIGEKILAKLETFEAMEKRIVDLENQLKAKGDYVHIRDNW
jgi:site-specific recombinase XerD